MDEHLTAESRKSMPRHRIHVQELRRPAAHSHASRMGRRVTLALLIVGAAAAAAFFYGPHATSVAQPPQQPKAPADTMVLAQQPQVPAAAAPTVLAQQQAPAAQKKAAPAAQQKDAPSVPQRIETVIYDAWTVICQDTLEKSSRKVCSAVNRIVESQSQQVIFIWQMSTDAQGRMIARLQTPTGVQIQRGVEIKLGEANPRRLMYTVCDQRSCQAEAVVEDQLLREATAAPEATATITLRDGRGVQFKMSMKGFDKAIASLIR